MRGISRRLFQLFALTFAAIIFLQSAQNLRANEKKISSGPTSSRFNR